MSDLVIQICDFHTKSKSAGKLIDKESFRNVINSQKFKDDLAKGCVLSLFTHKGRYTLDDQNIPFDDNVMTSPYLCAVGRKVWIDDNKDAAFGELDLLDTEYGKLWRDLIKKGLMRNTSMSVQAHLSPDGSKYIIDNILSLGDATLHEDLMAGVVSVSFSEKRGNARGVYNFSQNQSKDTIKINFDVNEKDRSDPELLKKYLAEFSETPTPESFVKEAVLETPKMDVQAVKPVENTKVPTDTSVVTNLDIGAVGGVAGVDVNSITQAATNMSYPITIKVDEIHSYSATSKEEFSQITKSLNSLGIKFELFSEDGAPVDINAPELDTSDMEKIHEDIPIEDQLTEQELIQLPNQITSQVNASEAGIINLISNKSGTKFKVFSFNGKSQIISRNELNSILTGNFSEGSLVGHEFSNKEKKFYVSNFSDNKYVVQFNTGATHKITSEKLLKLINTKNYSDISNFTIQSYLQELHMQPYQVLRRRINEVIQLCRGWKQDKIHNNIETLKSYFDAYILTWITRILNDPSQEFNIILGLRLQNYRVDNKKMRDLNRCIKRMRTQLNSTGFMNKQIQNELNAYFQAIENDLYEYINTELSKAGKYFK